MPSSSSASNPEALIPQSEVPYQVLPPLMTIDELREFKEGIKQIISKPSPSLSNVLDSIRQLVGQGAQPAKLKIDTLAALASFRLFNKTSFEVFKDK